MHSADNNILYEMVADFIVDDTGVVPQSEREILFIKISNSEALHQLVV